MLMHRLLLIIIKNAIGDCKKYIKMMHICNCILKIHLIICNFPEPYRRQKGWEKPDNKGQDFQPITKEQMEQLSLPAEWMQ